MVSVMLSLASKKTPAVALCDALLLLTLLLTVGCPADDGDGVDGSRLSSASLIEEYCSRQNDCYGRGEDKQAACVDKHTAELDGYVNDYGCAAQWRDLKACELREHACRESATGWDYFGPVSSYACHTERTSTKACMLDSAAPDNAAACRDALRQALQKVEALSCRVDAERLVYSIAPECKDYELYFCDLSDFWTCIQEAYSCDRTTSDDSLWKCYELESC